MPNSAPYTPGFGLAPPVLAGRDTLIRSLVAGVEAGPGHPMFVAALVGHRGVGKTSVLDAVSAQVEEDLGWPTTHIQAVREGGLLADVATALPASLRHWSKLGRDYHQLEKELTVKVNLGVLSGEASVRSPTKQMTDAARSFQDLFSHVGEFAARHHTGLLLTIDEASSATTSDLAGLARTIQTDVNRKKLPIAVLFSGLPSFREAIATAGTFAERLSILPVADLDTDAAKLALIAPAADLGVRWDPKALDAVLARAGGHAYYLQLFGYHTWEANDGGPHLTIEHAQAGIRRAEAVLNDQFTVTWARLRPLEQAVLTVIARDRGGPVRIADVAAALGRSPGQLDVTRRRLIHVHGLIHAPQRGRVAFHSPALAAWVHQTQPPVTEPPPRSRS